MTWQNLIQSNYSLTEKEYELYVKEVLASYQLAYDETKAKLQKVYAEVLSGLNAKEYRNAIYKYGRLDKLLDEIGKSYAIAAKKAGKNIVEGCTLNVANMYYRSVYSLSYAGTVIYPVLNDNLVAASVFGTQDAWKRLSKKIQDEYIDIMPQYGSLSQLLNDRAKESLDEIKRITTQTITQGNSYTEAAKEIKGAFNTAAWQAERIARTEGTRNLNAGSYMATQEARSAGVKIIRQWDATLDTHTRKTHGRADGQREDKNGMFTLSDGATGPYPGNMSTAGANANCRCSVIELPIDADGNIFTPELRRARDPVKEMQWENASASERRNRELKDGTKIYPRSQQTDIISNTSFTEWMDMNNLKYNKNGKITL